MAPATSMYPGAIPPPPGVIPDIDRVSPVTTLWFTATSVQLAFPTLSMLLRLYVRPVIIRTWTIADSVFTAAWIFFVITIGLGFLFPIFGIGDHAWNVSPERFAKFLRIENTQQAIYEVAICLSKTAVLLQLGEIFAPSVIYVRRRLILNGLIILNGLFFAAECLIRIFQCIPREKIWNPEIPGRCINVQKAFVSTGLVNVVEDFLILALPIVWIYWLNLPARRKITVTIVFAAGLFVCACSIMRLVGSFQSVNQTDLTYVMVPVSLWATAEESATLTICGFPLVPRLYKHIKNSSGGRTRPLAGPSFRTPRLNTIPAEPETMSMRNLTSAGSSLHIGQRVGGDSESEITRSASTRNDSVKTGNVSQIYAVPR